MGPHTAGSSAEVSPDTAGSRKRLGNQAAERVPRGGQEEEAMAGGSEG